MIPSVGRIVHYTLTNSDCVAINRRRKDASEKLDWHRALKSGSQVHIGNEVREGEVYPLIITKMWGSGETSAFNGQLMLDGNDQFWVTSTTMGEGTGKCFVPPRKE